MRPIIIRRFDPILDASAAEAIREANRKRRTETCGTCDQAKCNSMNGLHCMILNKPVSHLRPACSIHKGRQSK